MPYNVNKCCIIQLGTKSLKYDYEMSSVKLESVQCVEDLGVMIASNLKFSQQCKRAADKANRMLVYIKRNFSFKNKDIILLLYNCLVRSLRVCGAILVASSSKEHTKIRRYPAYGYEDDPFFA